MKRLAVLTLAAATAVTLMAADGATLYKKCAGCHGPHGEKKALGKSAVIKGWPKEKIIEALKGYKAGTRNVHGMGALMKAQVATLSDADIEAIADYLSKQ